MIEFKRNNDTGIVEIWKNGKYVGEMLTMGDEVIHNVFGKLPEQRERGNGQNGKSTSSGGRGNRRHG